MFLIIYKPYSKKKSKPYEPSAAEALVHGGFLPLFRVSYDLLVLPGDGDTPHHSAAIDP